MQRRHVLVLVAALIVLSCAGLLFPAVSATREAAARTTCMGHFKMWAVSLHQYADSHNGAFPPGTLPHVDLPPEHRLSWWVVVMPYFDVGAVCKEFDLTRGPGDPRNEQAASNRFQHIVCPSSGEYIREERGGRWKSDTPVTHYVGVSGVGPDAATLPLGHPRAGIFGYDRSTRLKEDIPDGMSNTLLIIETSHNPGHWAYGGPPTVRGFEQDGPAYIGPGLAFGGWHNGMSLPFRPRPYTCNAALADGSVRSLSSTTAPAVLEALATVNGKESLPADW